MQTALIETVFYIRVKNKNSKVIVKMELGRHYVPCSYDRFGNISEITSTAFVNLSEYKAYCNAVIQYAELYRSNVIETKEDFDNLEDIFWYNRQRICEVQKCL